MDALARFCFWFSWYPPSHCPLLLPPPRHPHLFPALSSCHDRNASVHRDGVVSDTLIPWCHSLSATHCDALQSTATYCNKHNDSLWTRIDIRISPIHQNFTHCDTLRHAATHCNTLHHTIANILTHFRHIPTHNFTHCNTLQHTATHCNTLQHTATHCNTLQHTATNTILSIDTYIHENHLGLCVYENRFYVSMRIVSMCLWESFLCVYENRFIDCTTITYSHHHFMHCIHKHTQNFTHCNSLQHTATHCNTLQHTATHCNTLQQQRHVYTITSCTAFIYMHIYEPWLYLLHTHTYVHNHFIHYIHIHAGIWIIM